MSVVVNPAAGGRVMVKPVSGGRIVYPSARAPAIAKPTLTIVGGTTDTSTTPTLQTSAFSSIGGVPVTQTATSWQVAEDAGFTTIVWQSNDDPDDLTEIVTGELGGGASLYARARHHGETSGGDPVSSPWSDAVAFTVAIDFEILDLEPVVWLDLREAGTMYQETARLTKPASNIATDGQPTGLIINQALGGLSNLGAELVTNGDFADGTGWTLGDGWSITGGRAEKVPSGSNGTLGQTLDTDAHQLYRLEYDVTIDPGTWSAFTIFGLNNVQFRVEQLPTPTDKSSSVLVTTSTANGFYVLAYPLTEGWIDNVSVKEVPGGHAQAAADDERPTFDASVPRIVHDGEVDQLTIRLADLGTDATVATLVAGTWSYLEGQTIGAGDYDLPTTNWTAVIILDRAMTSQEKTWLEAIT